MVRELKPNEVEFVLICHPEDIPIEGNASAIDPETDAEVQQWIEGELEQGNQWAWCCVEVVARWNEFEGRDFLGCCSYESEESFREPGGYFDDMKTQALDDLNAQLARVSDVLATLD